MKRRRYFKFLVVCGLATAYSFATSQTKSDPWKFSGTLFGDYYSVFGHHDSAIEGKSGFWIRRLYLTADRDLGDNLSGRLRLEASDPGDFVTSSNMEPFIKDAYLRYNANGHKVTLGLIPTPTWEPAESILGYRPIEKTPIDLFKMGSSRDKGISIQGPLDREKRADYWVMFGDGSGTKSSKGESHAFYGRVGFKATPEVTFDLYADFWRKDGDEEWSTLKGELFYQGQQLKGGLALVSQHRTKPGSPDVDLDLYSLYLEYKASDRFSPFARLDVVNDPVPGADTIAYFKMSKDGKPTLLILGVRYRVNSQVEIVPSIETISYRRGPGGIKPSSDSIFRVTFSAIF